MIYDSAEYVVKDLEFQTKLQQLYKNQLKGLPKGNLMSQTINQNTYYTKVIGDKRKYLGKEKTEEILLLQKKHFLNESLKRIETNINVMKKLLKYYKNISPETLASSFTKSYLPLPDNCFDLSKSINMNHWETAPYRRSKKHLEQLIHRTMKGDMVRSKSEVIIANMLTAKNIPYHYEEELDLLLPKITIAPDFKIAVPRENRFRLLEHCGMISDPDARSKYLQKLNTYLTNGYMPTRDVLFTFDDQAQHIDTQIISQIIDAFLL